MKISIVTPNFNYASTLDETISSVLSCHYPSTEYIILDGGSTDASQNIIRSYEGRLAFWESRPDDGPYHSINEGFQRTTGEIMAWLNSDDTYFPWTLQVVSEIFKAYPEVEWLTGVPGVYQRGGLRQVASVRPYPQEFLATGMFDGRSLSWIQQESTFWRRSLWNRAGPLNVDLRLAADFELWTRFAKFAKLYVTETPLSSFHFRGSGNRSIRAIKSYYAEVDQVLKRMAGPLKRGRERYQRELQLFQRFKPFTGFRGTLRRTLSVGRIEGSLLKWDRIEEKYRITVQRWLD